MATHSSILAWRIPWTTVHGVVKSRTRLSDFHFEGFLDSSVGKESAYNEGNLGLIPALGRSAGEGIGYPLQYSDLENSKDCIVHGVAKSRKDMTERLSLHLAKQACVQTRFPSS